MIIEVENKPTWTIKIWILQSRHTEIFSKGVTQDFVQKFEISSVFVFLAKYPSLLVNQSAH